MSDTLDEIDPGVLRMPNSTGENTVEAYSVWYPEDGYLQPGYGNAADALDQVSWHLGHYPGQHAMAVKITVERIDP